MTNKELIMALLQFPLDEVVHIKRVDVVGYREVKEVEIGEVSGKLVIVGE